MIVTVTGTGPRNSKLLTEAAEFFADILMDPRTVRNLQIDIEVSKDLDVLGDCGNEDDERSPRWFTIELKTQTADEMIKTLAHEMVHAKQYAKNELKSGFMVASRGGLKTTSKWMGKVWKPSRKEHHYYDSPWEVEAYGKEVGLFHRYVEWKNNAGK